MGAWRLLPRANHHNSKDRAGYDTGHRVRATIVMVSVVGLALKDHGRARTLKGLRAGDAGGLAAHRPAMLTLQGPCPAMVL